MLKVKLKLVLKINSLFILILLSNKCTHQNVQKNIFTMYYDDEKIRMQGPYDGNREQGEWTYFDERGSVMEKGSYKDGLLIGKWEYLYSKILDTIIEWKRIDTTMNEKKMQFSLPKDYHIENSSTPNKYIYISKSTRDIISIENSDYINDDNLLSWIGIIISGLEKENDVKSKEIRKITDEGQNSYYLVDFRLRNKKINLNYTLYYTIIPKRQETIITSYVTSNYRNEKQKVIYGNFLYHIYENKEKLLNSLIPIKNIETW